MKIVTWNTQGNALAYGKLKHLISTFNPDIICLQECGNIYGTSVRFFEYSYENSINYGIYKYREDDIYNVCFYPWRGASRCSMAVLVKSTFAISNYSLVDFYCIDEDESEDESEDEYEDEYEDDVSETVNSNDGEDDKEKRKGLRSMLRVDIEYNDDVISINNVHLPSGRPSFARKVGYKFIDYCCNNRPNNFIMIGDMNTLPSKWNARYSRLISNPRSFTHTGNNTLDYMFTNMKVLSKKVDTVFQSSDHLVVFYEL